MSGQYKKGEKVETQVKNVSNRDLKASSEGPKLVKEVRKIRSPVMIRSIQKAAEETGNQTTQ